MKKATHHHVPSIKYLHLRRELILSVFCLLVISVNAQDTSSAPNKKALDKRSELNTLSQKGPDRILLSDVRNGKIRQQTHPVTKADAPMHKISKDGHSPAMAIPNQQTTYTFTGKGSWFTATNWENSLVPPDRLKAGDQVVINGSGPCMFSNARLFILAEGSSIEVKQGKALYVSIGNNLLLQGGTITNDGMLTIVSGVFSQPIGAPGSVTNNGEFKTTVLSKVDGQIPNYTPPPKGHYKKADEKSGAAFVLDKDAANKPGVQ